MMYLGLLLFGTSLAMIALNLLGTLLVLFHFREKTPSKANSSQTEFKPITILKPLKGAEAGMLENLESFFTLDYPKYEMLFSVADRNDPACAIVDGLIAKYPHVDAKLYVGASAVGMNPKVNNIMKSYEESKYDQILISDSNVRVTPAYLKSVAPHLTDDTGVVTAVIVGGNDSGLGGRLDALFLNTFYARWMLLTQLFGFTTVLGKSMFFRKSVASRFGGIGALGMFLAEDYMTGQAMQKLGLKVKLIKYAVPQIIGKHSFKTFWDRHIRWGRMRKMQAPLALFGEPFTGAFLSGILGLVGAKLLFNANPAVYFAAHMALYFGMDFLVIRAIKGEIRYALPFFWIMREVLTLPLWIHTLSGNTIVWRGNQMRLLQGGILDHPDFSPAKKGAL